MGLFVLCEAEADDVSHGFELVVVLGVGVPAFYRVHEEARNGFTVFGEVADVSLQVVDDAHVSYEFPVLSLQLNSHKMHKEHRTVVLIAVYDTDGCLGCQGLNVEIGLPMYRMGRMGL